LSAGSGLEDEEHSNYPGDVKKNARDISLMHFSSEVRGAKVRTMILILASPATAVYNGIVADRNFALQTPPRLAGVEDRLVEASAALENAPDRVAQITGFDWIVSILMNAP
jgi:hypothetical protein